MEFILEYYVYEWYIVETDEVFYVGKGKNNRAKQLKRNKFFMDMYNTHNCNFRIKIDNLTEEEAFEYEKKLIKYYREFYPEYRLTNQTDGGEGVSGLKVSDEVKNKHSKFHKNLWKNEKYRNKMLKIRQSNDSVYKSKEFREKISKLVKGENNPNYNNHWSEKQKEELRNKMIGRYDGENNPNYNNRWNEEQKANLSMIRKDAKYNNENHGMAKRVICLETGEIFDCVKYAREKYKTIYVLGNNHIYLLGYHFLNIENNYIPNEEERFEILINFYKNNNKDKNGKNKYNIYICLEDKEIIIGLKKLQEVTEYGIKKIKNELRKNNKITINNKTYIELEKYSRII